MNAHMQYSSAKVKQVSKHWPEFAQNGKEGIRICDVLRHEAGLAALVSETEPEDGSKDYNITLQDIENLDAMAKIIASKCNQDYIDIR